MILSSHADIIRPFLQGPPGGWRYFSDAQVKSVDESTVLKCEAYMMFYERKYGPAQAAV